MNTTVNKTNYFLNTTVIWKELFTVSKYKDDDSADLKKLNDFITKIISEGYKLNYNSSVLREYVKTQNKFRKLPSSSIYFVKDDNIIRISDHFGKNIRSCDWFVNTKQQDDLPTLFFGNGGLLLFITIAKFSDFKIKNEEEN